MRHLILACICIGMISCDGKRPAKLLPVSPLPEGNGRQTYAMGDAKLETIAAQAKVVCEKSNPESCPSGVGLLLSVLPADGANAVIQCTSFLIDSQTIVTNSHCVDPSLRKAGSDCSGKIEIVFPSSPSAPERTRARCARVVFASEISEDKSTKLGTPDYAILKLEKPVGNRKHFEISRAGLSANARLTAFVFDPASDKRAGGTLFKRQCISFHGTSVISDATDDFAPVSAVSDCKLVQGNSGSPLIDSAGRVRALIFADAISSVPDNSKPIDAPAYLPVTAVANSACWIATGIEGDLGPHEGCTKARRNIFEIKAAEIPQTEFQKRFDDWNKKSDQRFKFKRARLYEATDATAPYTFFEQPQIECVKDPTVLNSESKDSKLDPHVLEIPRWGFAVTYDKYHLPQVTLQQIARFRVQLKFISSEPVSGVHKVIQTWQPQGPLAGIGEQREALLSLCR